MGSWGTGIMSNDDAEDVASEFRDLIANGATPLQATANLVGTFEADASTGDDHDFWLGLASTQHTLGHIAPGVIERALAIIADPAELQRWDSASRAGRRRALAALSNKLAKPPPAPRRLKPEVKVTTDLQPGQHIIVVLREDLRVLLRVTGFHTDRGGQSAQAAALAWDGRDRSLRRAHRLEAIPEPHPDQPGQARGFMLIGEPGDPDNIVVLDKMTDKRTPPTPQHTLWGVPWSRLHDFFVDSRTPTIT